MQFYLVLIFFNVMNYKLKCQLIYLYTLSYRDGCLDAIPDANTHLFDFQVWPDPPIDHYGGRDQQTGQGQWEHPPSPGLSDGQHLCSQNAVW